MKSLFFVICILVLLHAAGHVESSRRHRDDRRQASSYKLFVFGDTFVDNGNTDKQALTWWTRNWYKPYGVSDANHDNSPTGRFSDGKVQSDFLAMILGHDESPAPENMRRGDDDDDDSFGMNFAAGFSNAKAINTTASEFSAQIGRFRRLLKHGIISRDINQSVALVAFSGYDYTYIPHKDTDRHGYTNFIDDVTESIANGVSDIKELGVTKVLVNMLQPMGCSPRFTRTANNYTECIKSEITDIHNKKIKEKLGSEDSVLLLDLYTTFNQIIHPKSGTGFVHRHLPCCESNEAGGYCGQVDSWNGEELFQVCDKPDKYFYWDEYHPTQAGWKAVMDKLEDSIKEFLDIDS
ncbi:hypothetical protein EJB05_11691 [Eragrostis curvula]|uniref:SGNH hydrolase-type esterase domain-containing protein n=1 Tax=Eragrostis curvula TaxID=38414 RepID=A0A5J9VR86_9POAL|nr:hypothetical protein EJB05_11691 [Eragrostis curvula]